ncbi:MAG: glycine cleavage system protein GcvH [Lentisphaeria bacterium]|nr:glycine cleavage system protein GcvH [Lentisphaeria bacterium]
MSAQVKILKSHEWARVEDGVATVGITPFAVEQLGDIVFVEMPEMDTTVTQGDQFGEVESVKAASELFAPMSGKVIAVNEELEDDYSVLNRDAFGAGWMIKIAISDPAEFDSLLTEEAYQAMCAE